MKTNTLCALIAAMLWLLPACNTSQPIPASLKISENDPFRSTIVPSQEFSIDATKDNVVEGKNGTLLVCPTGCFVDGSGNVVKDNIKIELAEALSLENMLLSNLTTTADGKPLVTDGMIYFNATQNGKQLKVNKDIPVHIEIPTTKKKPGMKAWKGVRDSAGNMNWTNPKELDNYLVTVDLELLDFLPEHFYEAVEYGIPYRNHKIATKALADSLYYLLSVMNGNELIRGLIPTNYNEAYYNTNKKAVNGKYTDDSYNRGTDAGTRDTATLEKNADCGIDPAMIKVIKSKQYQNTVIATREFETRLKKIFETCHPSILEIYIKNLDKNLYELDSMAAVAEKAYGTHEADHLYNDFYAFSQQRLTKVKDADKYAALLQGYYEKRLKEVQRELETAKAIMIKALNEKNAEAKKLANDYKELLYKRETYRMETYGFNWTETGWVNIDDGIEPKSWGPAPAEVTVENGKTYDRVYTYIVYQNIKSLYRLNSDDNEKFYVGNASERQMLMPKQAPALLFAIGYKNDSPAIAVQNFTTNANIQVTLALTPSSMEKVKELISKYEAGYLTENKISVDLEYMTQFYKEQQRQKALIKEQEFFGMLWTVVYPCCETEHEREIKPDSVTAK
jgi:hypothetical protein